MKERNKDNEQKEKKTKLTTSIIFATQTVSMTHFLRTFAQYILCYGDKRKNRKYTHFFMDENK